MLAQTVIDIPLTDTMKTVVGLLGVITLAVMVLTFVILIKKVFGRKPSIGKELSDNSKALRSELYQVNGSTKKELNARFYALEKRVDKQDERFEELQLHLARQFAEARAEYHTLELAVAKLTGRIEALIEKLD